MNHQPETPESRETLLFEQKRPDRSAPVRMVMLKGVPYFYLEDICRAAGWNGLDHYHADRRTFPSFGKRTIEDMNGDGTPKSVTVLSPTGVLYFAHAVDPAQGQKITAWTKREARRICPGHPKNDPAMFLMLLEHDKMPPRPYKYSGWRSEWYELDEADAAGGDKEALRSGEVDHERARIEAERWAALERFAAAEAALKLEGAN